MDTSSLVAQITFNQITSLKITSRRELVEFGRTESMAILIERLLNLLVHNSSVTHLDLRDLRIYDDSAQHIAQLLQHNTHLLDINLSYNRIGAKGAKAIAEALKVNSTLESIDLSNTRIGPEGGKAVAEALKVNSTLQTIYLGIRNYIGEEGVKAIAEAIKLNSTLQTIRIEDHLTCQIIAETLKKNSLQKKMNYCKLICKFTAYHADSIRLRFDKMMLRYEFYPLLGVLFDEMARNKSSYVICAIL
jgi:Ran GTPase-activating protein (RanGAP) involved in mRNA processing and transport